MKENESKLIRLLLDQNEQLNAGQIAGMLSVSVRSVHNYIKSVNKEYPQLITSINNVYRIDQQTGHSLLHESSNVIPQNSRERCNYVLNKLLQANTTLNIYDLCEEMYISTTTFQGLTRTMRRIAREHNLTFSIASDNVSLKGNEQNKRRLLSDLLINETSSVFTNLDDFQAAFPNINIYAIRAHVLSVLQKHNFFINDFSLISLILHITIAIDRIHNGYSAEISETAFQDQAIQLKKELPLARTLVSKFEKDEHITFSSAETLQLALLLSTRATSIDYQTVNEDNLGNYIPEKDLNLIHLLIDTLVSDFDIHLDNTGLLCRFALHIHNLLIRGRRNFFCKNPLRDEIQRSCPLIYDVSVRLSGIIMQHTGISINDDEIAYIAFHLGVAIEMKKELSEKIQAVLLCPEYYDQGATLAQRICRKTDDKILLNNVYTKEEDLVQAETDKTILVISTIQLRKDLSYPYVRISPFLTNMDCVALLRKTESIQRDQRKEKIRNNLQQIMHSELFFVDRSFKNRNDAIHQLCKNLKQLGYVNDDFESDVLCREELSSTGYGQFAVPHSLKMLAKKSGMSICITKSPVEWNDTSVSLIILLCFNPDERKIFYEIFEPLCMLLQDPLRLKTLLGCINYQQFLDYLVDNME